MDHEKLRKQVHMGIDHRCSSLTSDPYRVQRILTAAGQEGEKKLTRKIPRIIVVLSVLLALGISTAIAAGVIYRNRGLEDMLRITGETREYYGHTGLFDEPGMSVTQNGVTITLEESIVDSHAAYLAFRVKGWQPPAGQQPTFASATFTTDDAGLISTSSGSFFNGLVINGEGRAVYPDGSAPEDDNAVSFVDENGEMVYAISLFSDIGGLIGQTMQVTLTDLGVCTDKQGTTDVKVPGTWAFDWTLNGTDHSWDFSYLALDVGTTGATITAVELSPIHIDLTMNVDLTYRDYQRRSDRDPFIPQFCGVQMKGGTQYRLITEAGFERYTSPDPDGRVYRMLYSLNRVIEPARVDYLLFSCLNEAGEQEIARVKFN